MTEEALNELNRKIAVMEASKTQMIQFREDYLGEWTDMKSEEGPSWDWIHYDYRVKSVEPARLYKDALGGVYWTPTGEVVGEFIELTPSVREKLGL